MKYAKLLAMGCAVALATVGMTGCTKTTADSTQTSEAEESESVTAQVTAVDGNTVTADLGEMAEMQAPGDGQAPGEAPEKPDGEAPSGEAPEKPDGESTDGEAPEKPDGEAPSGETPAKPDGDSSDSQAPSDNGNGNGGVPNGAPDGDGQAPSMFTASGEAITFTPVSYTHLVNLNMAIQAALELCFFEFFTAPEHAVWELAVVNGIEIPIFYRMYRESRIREQLDETEPKRGGKNAVWKRKSRAVRLLLAILGGLFLGRGFNLLIGLTPLPTLFPGYETAADRMYTGNLLSLVAASVVTAPILEELLVRGVLYRNLKGVLQNRYAGMACASLLFGILHGNLVQGLFAFLIGLYLNWIYESEGSLLPAILAHAAVNVSTIFLERMPEWQNVLYGSLPLYLAVTAVCLLAGFEIWKKFPLSKEK